MRLFGLFEPCIRHIGLNAEVFPGGTGEPLK